MGPSLDLVLRRHQPADPELFKQAMKRPKLKKTDVEKGLGKKKNMEVDDMGDLRGRVHIAKQDLGKLQTRKMKGSKAGADDMDVEDDGLTSPPKRHQEASRLLIFPSSSRRATSDRRLPPTSIFVSRHFCHPMTVDADSWRFFPVAEWTTALESLYVVADLDSTDGLDLVKEALTSLVCLCLEIHWVYSNHSVLQAPDSKTRLAFVHDPSTAQSPTVDHEHPFPGFSLTSTLASFFPTLHRLLYSLRLALMF